MKSWISYFAILSAFLVTSVHAQEIVDVRVVPDATDFVLAFETKSEVRSPTVRVSSGQVKLWFEDAAEQASIKQKLRTAPMGMVDVRSGAENTALVKVKFDERIPLASADVRVEKQGTIATVRIARALFPSLAPLPLPPPPPPPMVKETPKLEQAKAPVPPVLPAAKASVPETPAATPIKLTKAAKPTTFAPPTDSSLPALLAVSALLLLVYAATRWLVQKGQPKLPAPIDIVAQKRLGPRHQLLIVRAFGRDHLLSVQGGNTTRIASAKAGQMLAEGASLATGNLDYENEPTAVREQSMFGAALLRHALDDRLRDVGGDTRREEKEPDSVSGLLRLRREAGL